MGLPHPRLLPIFALVFSLIHLYQWGPGCPISSDSIGDLHALPFANCVSRVSSDRSCPFVPILKLFAAGLSRPIIAPDWVLIPAPNHVGIRLDDEYAATHSGHKFADSNRRSRDRSRGSKRRRISSAHEVG
jgi:hypothetical protein